MKTSTQSAAAVLKASPCKRRSVGKGLRISVQIYCVATFGILFTVPVATPQDYRTGNGAKEGKQHDEMAGATSLCGNAAMLGFL